MIPTVAAGAEESGGGRSGYLRGGFLDAVVVWHLDRLHRQPKELEEFFELCAEADVHRLASVSGDIDPPDHSEA